jgi:hypothetical protein
MMSARFPNDGGDQSWGISEIDLISRGKSNTNTSQLIALLPHAQRTDAHRASTRACFYYVLLLFQVKHPSTSNSKISQDEWGAAHCVGWVERSETHHRAARASDRFRERSTHPTTNGAASTLSRASDTCRRDRPVRWSLCPSRRGRGQRQASSCRSASRQVA